MKKIFFILFSVVELAVCSNGQPIDTVITNNDGKIPPVYTANKLYYEKNYDSLRHLIFEGLKFNSCYLGTIIYYWPTGKIKNIQKYFIDKPDSSDLKSWPWMKKYRVWEANRKVFVYPENWIEPDLRDDKSPYFKKLEKELRCNIPDGEWKSYDKEGRLSTTILYDKGKKVKSY
jgi:antitoxin component YwqK of YwqJK toxin-antitoxin module